jgi:hypothetical protein
MPCIALGRDDFAFYPTDCSVMPFLRILCPIKKKSFATSVETSVQHKASLPNIIKFSYCPYCCTLHAWTPDEAFFDDLEHEASEHEASEHAHCQPQSVEEMTAPTSSGIFRGMGTVDRGRALAGRTGPEFIEAPIFKNLILIKKSLET